MVVPILLYHCENWNMNQGDDKVIDLFLNNSLRRILKIRWQDHVKMTEQLQYASIESLRVKIRQR